MAESAKDAEIKTNDKLNDATQAAIGSKEENGCTFPCEKPNCECDVDDMRLAAIDITVEGLINDYRLDLVDGIVYVDIHSLAKYSMLFKTMLENDKRRSVTSIPYLDITTKNMAEIHTFIDSDVDLSATSEQFFVILDYLQFRKKYVQNLILQRINDKEYTKPFIIPDGYAEFLFNRLFNNKYGIANVLRNIHLNKFFINCKDLTNKYLDALKRYANGEAEVDISYEEYDDSRTEDGDRYLPYD